jgi:hypothetical protein
MNGVRPLERIAWAVRGHPDRPTCRRHPPTASSGSGTSLSRPMAAPTASTGRLVREQCAPSHGCSSCRRVRCRCNGFNGHGGSMHAVGAARHRRRPFRPPLGTPGRHMAARRAGPPVGPGTSVEWVAADFATAGIHRVGRTIRPASWHRSHQPPGLPFGRAPQEGHSPGSSGTWSKRTLHPRGSRPSSCCDRNSATRHAIS